jgi:DNA invertase Pin-like site-specific DNA recombinase
VWTETTSGAGRRPVLDQLLEVAVAGDVIVVSALDRLGRVGVSLVQLVDELTRRGVALRTLRGDIDTTDPVAGRIALYVMAALAEAERALVVERTRAGLTAARAAGRTGGRPTVITTDRLEVARRLIGDGSTIAAAARTIGVSRSTLSRHLVT